MTQYQFQQLEAYMHSCMRDSAHDREHVYRVLYTALDIAATEAAVDYDILITACLLHDIGRQEQFLDSRVCHASAGAEKAFVFLTANGYSESFSRQVAACIRSHRFRKDTPPESLEAKILFDADKLDAAGVMGIARTLLYNGSLGEPLYSLRDDGSISDGTGDTQTSFFQEYKYKLERIYDRFFTARGRALALQRHDAAKALYTSLLSEARQAYSGKEQLQAYFTAHPDLE